MQDKPSKLRRLFSIIAGWFRKRKRTKLLKEIKISRRNYDGYTTEQLAAELWRLEPEEQARWI